MALTDSLGLTIEERVDRLDALVNKMNLRTSGPEIIRGSFAGWQAHRNYFVSPQNNVGFNSEETASTDWRIWAGNTYANRASAPFRVDDAGNLVATSATITGSITATSGFIGGWKITTTTLESTDGRVFLDHGNKVIAIKDTTPVTRVKIGTIGTDYGIQVFETDGTTEVMGVYGSNQFLKNLDVEGTLDILSGGKIRTNSGVAPYIELTDQTLTIYDAGTGSPTDATLKIVNSSAPSYEFLVRMLDNGAVWVANYKSASGNTGFVLEPDGFISLYRYGVNFGFIDGTPGWPGLNFSVDGGTQYEFDLLITSTTQDGLFAVHNTNATYGVDMTLEGKLAINPSSLTAQPTHLLEVWDGTTEWVYVNTNGALHSAVTTGTAPFVVASTTLVTNLNADTVDGQHASDLTGSNERCKIYNSSNISIPNSTITELTFDSEQFDTDTMHSTVSNTGRITFNTAGVYLIIAMVEFDANSSGKRQLLVYRNGTELICAQGQQPVGSGNTTMSTSVIYNMSSSDYIQAKVRQTSGGSLNVVSWSGSSHYYTPSFMAHRLS